MWVGGGGVVRVFYVFCKIKKQIKIKGLLKGKIVYHFLYNDVRFCEYLHCSTVHGGHSSLHNAVGVGRVLDSTGKRYEHVWLKVISVTRGWVGVKFPEKKCYVTLEWSHC